MPWLACKVPWHSSYEDSAGMLLGVLPQELTKGDSLSGFSQYGEIVNMNFTRARKTSFKFSFTRYEDQ